MRGVPQGSILGPFLLITTKIIVLNVYVDGTQIHYISFFIFIMVYLEDVVYKITLSSQSYNQVFVDH